MIKDPCSNSNEVIAILCSKAAGNGTTIIIDGIKDLLCQVYFSLKSVQYPINMLLTSEKGLIYMKNEIELNRLEFMILNSLYYNKCTDHYHSMTITDIMNDSEGTLGARMTIYRKLQKLTKIGQIKKGCLDNHADTFYLSEKGIQTVEGGKER